MAQRIASITLWSLAVAFVIAICACIINVHAADLRIPKLHQRQQLITIGVTPLPSENLPPACTSQLKEMRLCR